MRRLLLAVLAACGPIRPTEGPPLPVVSEPALPVIPPATPAGCIGIVGEDVAQLPVWRDIQRYDEAWLARATARRGWTALPPAQTVARVANSTRPGFDLMMGEEHLRAMRPDLLLDEHGQLWLKTRLQFQCSRDEPRFYSDSDLGVFEVEPQPHCLQTREVSLCGDYAAGGCGTNPGPQDAESISEWFFVPVPRGAHWLGIREVAIRDDVPVCFQAKPATISTPP